jgi:threonylcarbamoyladenosine tRNA methylthiotransferase MtaB
MATAADNTPGPRLAAGAAGTPGHAGRPRTVAFRTLGCKLNQCETAQMQETLLAEGYHLVGWDSAADIRVVNTCTVTAKSDRACRHEIRAAKRLDPASTMVVTGCLAQIDPETVAAIPGVALVLGNLDKLRLAEHLTASAPGAGRRPPTLSVSPYPEHPDFEGEFFSHFYGYTRAFLKVQTGCDSHCAYCIIPTARGPARSMRLADVLHEAGLLAERGFREVVLTGINLGDWGRDTGEGTIADLLGALLDHAVPRAGEPERVPASLGRLRLSSIEPLEVDAALLAVIDGAGDRVAHHFHLPLQSGSDAVLRRMNRPYTAEEYLGVVTEVSRRFPDAALGADVIVGFPDETEGEFAETLSFVENAPLTYLHVFAYSDRPGTKASQMRPKVPPETIHERSLRLRLLGERKKAAFRDRLRGTGQRALVLHQRDAAGRLVSISGNYMEVVFDGADELMNRFAEVRLEEPGEDGRWTGTLLSVEGPAGGLAPGAADHTSYAATEPATTGEDLA